MPYKPSVSLSKSTTDVTSSTYEFSSKLKGSSLPSLIMLVITFRPSKPTEKSHLRVNILVDLKVVLTLHSKCSEILSKSRLSKGGAYPREGR